METVKFTLTNGCTCTQADEDGNEVLDANGYPVSADYCYGCFDEAREAFDEVIVLPWLNNIGNSAEAIVSYNGMSWRRTAGETYFQFDPADRGTTGEGLVNLLSLNGDWTQYWTLTLDDERGASLSCLRTSHDEPTGASFEFEALCAKCGVVH